MSDDMTFRAGWLYLHDAGDGRPVRVRVDHVSALRELNVGEVASVFVMTTGGSLIHVRDSLAEVELEYERAKNSVVLTISNANEADLLPSMFLGNRPHPISPEEVRRRANELLDSLPKPKKRKRGTTRSGQRSSSQEK